MVTFSIMRETIRTRFNIAFFVPGDGDVLLEPEPPHRQPEEPHGVGQ
jgi:hypothetical protein